MEITYKTGKTNLYVINNASLKRHDIHNTKGLINKTLIFANNILDNEIVVVTHGTKNGNILLSTIQSQEYIMYYELGQKLKDLFIALNKIELVCCYNSCMKNIKYDSISICISDDIRADGEIYLDGFKRDKIMGYINLVLQV